MKRLLILFSIVVLVSVVGVGWLYLQKPTVSSEDTKPGEVISETTGVVECLGDDQIVDYKFDDQRMMAESYLEVFVKNKETEEVEVSFKTDLRTSYHPFEVHKCGVYLTKLSGMDYKKVKPLPDFKESFWKYDYKGRGQELIDLTANSYSTDFRISPDEKYLVLQRGYGGSNDYALVIKDLVTLEDLLVLPRKQLFEEDQIGGGFGLLNWTEDGRYYWADLHDGAYVYGWIRIDAIDWSYEVYEAPEGTLGGDPLDLETGWIPFSPGSYWTGSNDDEVIREERLQMGITSGSLYLYNVITKEKRLVHTEPDPVWTGWPVKWLDDSTIEYTMPDGTTKTFSLHNL